MPSNIKTPLLDKELHLRIPSDFERTLAFIATAHNLKKSTFVRAVLMREIANYHPDRMWTGT